MTIYSLIRDSAIILTVVIFVLFAKTSGRNDVQHVITAGHQHSLECYVFADVSKGGQQLLWTRTFETSSIEILMDVELSSNEINVYNSNFSYEYTQQGTQYSLNLCFTETSPNDSATYTCEFRTGTFQQVVATVIMRIIKCICSIEKTHSANPSLQEVMCALDGFNSATKLSTVVFADGRRISAFIRGDALEFSLSKDLNESASSIIFNPFFDATGFVTCQLPNRVLQSSPPMSFDPSESTSNSLPASTSWTWDPESLAVTLNDATISTWHSHTTTFPSRLPDAISPTGNKTKTHTLYVIITISVLGTSLFIILGIVLYFVFRRQQGKKSFRNVTITGKGRHADDDAPVRYQPSMIMKPEGGTESKSYQNVHADRDVEKDASVSLDICEHVYENPHRSRQIQRRPKPSFWGPNLHECESNPRGGRRR